MAIFGTAFGTCTSRKKGRIQIVKVKAHCNDGDTDSGVTSHRELAGNAYANAIANEAAKRCQVSGVIMDEVDAADELSHKIQRRIAALTCLHPTKEADGRDATAHRKHKKELQRLAQEERALEPEELEPELSDAQEESAPQCEADLRALISPEVVDDSSLPFDPSHHIRHRNGVWWCTRCGCYAANRGRKLREACTGPNKTGKACLARIARGPTPHNSVRWGGAEG